MVRVVFFRSSVRGVVAPEIRWNGKRIEMREKEEKESVRDEMGRESRQQGNEQG